MPASAHLLRCMLADQPDLIAGAKEALKLVTDVSKQLVTLATATAGGFVAAIKAGVVVVSDDPQWLLGVFFGSMVLTVIGAIWLQLSVSGTFDALSFPGRSESAAKAKEDPSIYAPHIRTPLAVMLVTFVAALVALVILVFT